MIDKTIVVVAVSLPVVF